MVRPDRDPELARVARGCWVNSTRVADFRVRCFAALDTSAEYTVVAVTTAGWLHGLWLPPGLSAIHLATATPGTPGRSMTRTRKPEFVAHRYQLGDDDIVSIDGLLVTSLARTWRDLAGYLPLPDLVAAGDSALRAGAEMDSLTEVVSRTPRRAHTAKARAALQLLDARSESRPESHLRVAVSAPDLPRFAVNVAVSRKSGGWLGVPDLSLDEAAIGLEYQGEEHATLRRMRKDLVRFADFRSEGWLMLAYGPTQVFSRPWEIEAETRIAVTQRAPQLLGVRRRQVVSLGR